MTENWLPVVGFEGMYEVSDQGRVKSFRQNLPRILKPYPTSKGHLAVHLQGHDIARRARVHHLVLEAFVGPRPSGLLGLHNDGIKTNNAVSNLRWDTYSANNLDAVAHGTHHQSRKTRCPYDHPLDGVSSRGGRYCKTCNNERNQEAKAERRKKVRCQTESCENVKTPGQANRYCDECRSKMADMRKVRARQRVAKWREKNAK